jgi:hypothetical protein
MRSSLATAARSLASRDRLTFPAGISSPSGRFVIAIAKPPGKFLERRQQRCLLDLDFAKPGPQRNASDPFGLTRFGLSQLILQARDLFPDFR